MELPLSLLPAPHTPKYRISCPHNPGAAGSRRERKAAALFCPQVCPRGLMKPPPFCTEDVSGIPSWPWLWTSPAKPHLCSRTTSGGLLLRQAHLSSFPEAPPFLWPGMVGPHVRGTLSSCGLEVCPPLPPRKVCGNHHHGDLLLSCWVGALRGGRQETLANAGMDLFSYFRPGMQ